MKKNWSDWKILAWIDDDYFVKLDPLHVTWQIMQIA